MKKKVPVLLCLIFLNALANAQQEPFLQGQKIIGNSILNYPTQIEQTKDGGCIVIGYQYFANVINNHAEVEYLIVKLDKNRNIEWQRTYGGINDDYGYSIQQTSDGGYIAAGSTYSNNGDVTNNHGASDCWVLKLDKKGNILWQKCYGGTGNDAAKSIIETFEGGYIIVGQSDSKNGDVTGNHGRLDYWVVKLNNNGGIEWQKSYGGSKDDFPFSISPIKDSGYIIAGYSNSNDGDITGNKGYDYWLLKITAAGNIQWQKCYGPSGGYKTGNALQTNDGGYIFGGCVDAVSGDVTQNFGLSDYWLLKLDAAGNKQWQKSYGGKKDEQAYHVEQTKDGGYVIAGSSRSNDSYVKGNHGQDDFWIVKTDRLGNEVWQTSLGGTSNDDASSIEQTDDGGYIIAGSTESNDENVSGYNGGIGGWVVKLSPDILDNNIKVKSFTEADNCTASNAISFEILNDTGSYSVKLYRFGVLYDSAWNIKRNKEFKNLPGGSYYATASANKNVSFSSPVSLLPPAPNLRTTNITPTTAVIAWTKLDCATNYEIQYRKKGTGSWKTRFTDKTSYRLQKLQDYIVYECKLISIKVVNGIKATSDALDSIQFMTKFGHDFSLDESESIGASNFTVLPNPAKNYFIINYKDVVHRKLNAVLFDINGKCVWTSGLISSDILNDKKINTAQLTAGVYYLKLTDENRKFINATKVIIAN